MHLPVWFFISSGIFLGWSLGANHAVNLFGTAVISKMVKYRTAALVAGLFVTLGAVVGGAGTAKTLNELGAVNALAGSFTVALAVGFSVYWMTKLRLPVSTSQAVVGGIIGWNIFTGSPTDMNSLSKILITWIASPILAALFGFVLYWGARIFLSRARLHMLELDAYTRAGLIIVGAFASYSLGANNIANVMGLFVSSAPFRDAALFGGISLSGIQILFLIGGIAIAAGIFTYGYEVMVTVGTDLYKVTPISGLVVVLAESIVLFLFSSTSLERLLLNVGLPAIPLVPLSSTQAVIGAVIGVGMAKNSKGINYQVLGRIVTGWVSAPIIAGLLVLVSLFFVQNVFEQDVVKPVPYEISKSVLSALDKAGISSKEIAQLKGKRFYNTKTFKNELAARKNYAEPELFAICQLAIIDSFKVDSNLVIREFENSQLDSVETSRLKLLHGKTFNHKHDFEAVLLNILPGWSTSDSPLKTKENDEKLSLVFETFRIKRK